MGKLNRARAEGADGFRPIVVLDNGVLEWVDSPPTLEVQGTLRDLVTRIQGLETTNQSLKKSLSEAQESLAALLDQQHKQANRKFRGKQTASTPTESKGPAEDKGEGNSTGTKNRKLQ